MDVQYHVPLAPLTSLRLGGPAARLVEVTTDQEVEQAVCEVANPGEPVFVLGGGSNVIVADNGWPGLVVRMALGGVRVQRQETGVRVEAAAGEAWDGLVAHAVQQGWSGVECLSGIPGLVGACPVQNVGAYGQEVGDIVVSVRAYDRQRLEFVEFDRAACAFAYRRSVFKEQDRYIITRVTFDLAVSSLSQPVRYAELARTLGVREGDCVPARVVREAVLSLRRAKGMILDPADPETATAGSYFLNPVLSAAESKALEERLRSCGVLGSTEPMRGHATPDGGTKVPAAWLIETAGFTKGIGRSGIGISRRHALALVNRGGGTTRELLAFEAEIVAAVQDKFGVRLHREPVLVGVPACS